MFNIFKRNRATVDQAKPYIDRISFLMNYLNGLLLKDKHDVINALNNSLLLSIPADIPDPENMGWPDPSCKNLTIGFACDPIINPNSVGQFILTGFEDIDNILIIGTGHDNKSSSWSIVNETQLRPVPPLAALIQKEFWKIPGWNETESISDEFRFLKKDET